MSFSGDGLLSVAGSNNNHNNNNHRSALSLVDGLGAAPRPARATGLRFAVLLCASSFMFGNYYFFDQTSATEQAVRNQTGMSEEEFGILSSVYSWPNVILPLFGGLLIDRMGIRVAVVLFTSLVLLGSFLFTLGLWTKSIWLLILGRVVFGLGGESQNVTSLTLISRWFVGKELAFAMSVNIAVSRLGSVAAFDTQPALIAAVGVTGASAVGTSICLMSFSAALLVIFLDRLGERRDAAAGLTVTAPSDNALDEPVKLSDILHLGRLFWLVSIACVSVYVAAFPFIQVTSVPYLYDRFGFEPNQADFINSLPNLVSAFASPVAGLLADRFGNRPPLILLATVMFIVCNMIFIVYPRCELCWGITAVYAALGAALSLFGSVIWPCIPLVVRPETVGTAIGLTTAMQNFGMAISPMLLTYLHSVSGAFVLPFLYIIACCSMGLVAACCLWTIDSRGARILSRAGGSN